MAASLASRLGLSPAEISKVPATWVPTPTSSNSSVYGRDRT